MSRYFLLRVYRVRMRGVLRSFAYILKRRAATVTEYAGRARKKRRAWGGGGGGGTKMPVSVSRERGTRVVEGCWREGIEGIEGGSREDKNGRVNEKREKSRAALRFQTHRYYTVH